MDELIAISKPIKQVTQPLDLEDYISANPAWIGKKVIKCENICREMALGDELPERFAENRFQDA